jgi:hypothetical protein
MKIQSHNHKPEPYFFGEDEYHLGLELEVEAPDERAKDAGLNISQQPRYCYAKHDGTLNEGVGWELVTHPISRALWMDKTAKRSCVSSFFDLIKGLRGLGYTSHAGSRCGLHIHIGYSAFRGAVTHHLVYARMRNGDLVCNRSSVTKIVPRRPHLYWFARLINSQLFRQISQRDKNSLETWAALCPVATRDFHRLGRARRYMATNFTDKTLEVRIFRGNMREERIRKCIESVVAGVEFTRQITYRTRLSELTAAFESYVVDHRATYPNLYNYLVEINVLTASVEAPKKAGNVTKDRAKIDGARLERRRKEKLKKGTKACV